jgi:hypothetical protein
VKIGLLLAVTACGFSATASPAIAGVPPTLGAGGCYDPTQTNADFEAYGPTDVTAQAGNGRVTANENAQGTLTVFKYPDPSLFNLIKFFAVTRDAQGVVHAQYPNEGSFAGIRYTTRTGEKGFAWLRDWKASQRYDSPDTPVPVTTYRSPRRLGLTVTDFDLVPPGRDHLVRDYWVNRTRRSPVRRASLVYFENFNPVASHTPLLPIGDWCISTQTDGHAAYDARTSSIVNDWTGTDQATGTARTIAVAFGFAGRSARHQVGEDAYDSAAMPGGPPDAFDQAPSGLGGDDAADGQTDGALEQRLRFDRRGRAEARMTIAAGQDPAKALAALEAGRRVSFARQWAAEHRDWHRFERRLRLPRSPDRRVVNVAKRSLISVRLARAARTGAIVASVNTQGPYGEDWIRDGAFMNRLLDDNGLTKWVTQHNRFYVRTQASAENPSAIRPPGNWSMASYSDGVDGAPIPWEIDETGLGAWTLFDHYHFLHGPAAKRYLQEVYPAIGRAADFMTACQDPVSGLQCIANEDDSYTQSQSLHGAGPVLLGLESAIAAAGVLGDTSARVGLWRQRAQRLRAAIDALYDPKTRAYQNGFSAGNTYFMDYGDGGWMLWPVAFKPYSDETMIGEADHVYDAMSKSLAAPRGQYEAKALLGLGYAWQPLSDVHRQELRQALALVAHSQTTSTGLLGESWKRLDDGRTIPVQDQPHVWEHTLFYLSAIKIEGGRRYRFSGRDAYRRYCARRALPKRAC